MSKPNKKREVKEECPIVESVNTINNDKDKSALEQFKDSLLAIDHGNREIDIAVLDAMKMIEQLETLSKFIAKALKEKK